MSFDLRKQVPPARPMTTADSAPRASIAAGCGNFAVKDWKRWKE